MYQQRPPLPTAFAGLAILSGVLGLVAGFMDGPLLGLYSMEFFIGAVGFGLLTMNHLVVVIPPPPKPPRPTCPPYCPIICWVALIVFVIAVVAAWFLGGSFLGISAGEWFTLFVALSLLCVSGHLYWHLSSIHANGESPDRTFVDPTGPVQ